MKLLSRIIRFKFKAKAVLSAFAIYISISGLVTFSLFIVEESIQTAMFASWPAQDAKDWHTVKFASERIKEANQLLRAINFSLGWIQPLAFLAYNSYARSTDVYINGMEAKIFANAPELFAGERVTITFFPQEVQQIAKGFLHINRNVCLISKTRYPPGSRIRVSGLVAVEDGRIIIEEK